MARRRRGWLPGWLTLAAASTAAAAQTGPETRQEESSSQDILVIGERPEPREETSTFLERHAVESRIGQLARWHEPVCVRAWGLPLEQNALISTLVMDVADRIGARTDRSELCRPNVRIGFTEDPQGTIDAVARRNHFVLGFHYARQHDRLARIRFPVQSWYATTTRGADGDDRLDAVGYETVSGRAGSRLTSELSSGFAHVLVLADRRIVEGREAAEIADLIAFLALAQSTPAEDCDPAGTILNLLNEACAPEQRDRALSDRDLAYLEALYEVNSTLGPQLQRGSIAVQMTRELTNRRTAESAGAGGD